MKSKKLLLLVLPLLVACGGDKTSSILNGTSNSASNSNSLNGTSSSSTSSIQKGLNIENVLADLSKGVKVEVTGIETFGSTTRNIYLTNTSKNKEFSFIQYIDENRDSKALHEYYTHKDNDNYVYSTRLNVNNTYNYYALYNPATSQNYTWEEGYNNPFALLTVDSFEKNDDLTYTLKAEEMAKVSNSLTNLLYGNPGLNLDDFYMYEEDDSLKFFASASFTGNSTVYNYIFDATVVELGENTKMDYRSVPFAEVEDANFSAMLAELAGNNYTATIVNDDGFDQETSLYYTNEDKVYYETGGYKVGFYVLEDESIQEVENKDGVFYKVGAPYEDASLDEVRPSFRLNPACFDLENGVYTLKTGLEGSMSVVTILEAWADTLNDFTITKTEDGYVFVNEDNDCITTVTITNIGTTDVGFTAEEVQEPLVSTSWGDVISEEDYLFLVNIVGEEVAQMIPVPANYNEWAQFSEEPEFAMFVAEFQVEDDIFAYYLALEEAGFNVYEDTSDLFGTDAIIGAMEVSINGVTQILVVEFTIDESLGEPMFVVAVYCITE